MYSIHYVVHYLVRTVVRTVLELESRCDRSHRSATIVESHQSEFVRHSQGSSIPFSIIASDNSRYLLKTRDRGMVIAPESNLKLDCFCDADFAGLYGHEDDQDPGSAQSRSRYVCTLGEIPFLWGSKMQTEIALSTLESEHIACSTAMRELVPLRSCLMDELSLSLSLNPDSATMVSTVWEDNNGALALANKAPPFMTPRTKHIAIKYHWFRGKIRIGKIEVEKIDTAIQKADIFTKGLRQVEFESKQILVKGW